MSVGRLVMFYGLKCREIYFERLESGYIYFASFSCNLGVKMFGFHFNLKLSGNTAEM